MEFRPIGTRIVRLAGTAAIVLFVLGCNGAQQSSPISASLPAGRLTPTAPSADSAPPTSQTGGFDGAKAFAHVAKLVSFGPRPPASDAIHNAQDYIRSQLNSFGCAVEEDDFNAQTPIGILAMKNIVAKVPGTGRRIILVLTHYDTLRLANFVGAEDGGSSAGLMLEMARLLCAGTKRSNAVWIAFLDGEEAQVVQDGVAQWTNSDSVYGSRELAARLAVSGDLKRIKAVILADMVGQYDLHIRRDSDAPKWLTEIIWRTAARLGHQDVFIAQETSTQDDHLPFIHRGVPAIDIIDLLDYQNLGYWHTPQDTLDKVSPRSLAIVGQVILGSVSELENR